jgi:hypothetical protein
MTNAGDNRNPDVRAVAEAIAEVLLERGVVIYATPGSVAARVLSVAEVARLLGRRPAWVYAHAAELGAIRFGDGPLARIGFDLGTIEQWKRDRQMRKPSMGRRAPRRGRAPRARGDTNLIAYEPDPRYRA